MAHSEEPAAAVEERVRAVLDGLRTVAKGRDLGGVNSADATSVLDEAWSTLSDVLLEASTPRAGELLDALRQMLCVDQQMHRLRAASGIGRVLAVLESAQCSAPDLLDIAPSLIAELGFDRAIMSRVDDGMWISERAYVADDPEWSEAITRVGREHPQPLVPGLMETRVVRRRQAVLVYGVQDSPRVHRPIADESRSRSYVAAPILSGNHVIGMLHGDRYLQGRDVDDADREMLTSFARGLELALSRASVVDTLTSIGNTVRAVSSQLDRTTAGARQGISVGLPARDDGCGPVVSPSHSVAGGHSENSARESLTDRELQVLDLIAQGRTNAAIASRLVISEATVKQHVKHILRKLRVGNRAEAVSRLYQPAAH